MDAAAIFRTEPVSPKQRLQLEIKWQMYMHLPKWTGHTALVSSAL